MKKIFTLLVLCFTMFSIVAYSQTGNTCNAEFSFQFLDSGNVKFTPVDSSGTPSTTHYWNFSIGFSSSLISPTQLFSNGVYTVTHTIYKQNPNGVDSCTATASHEIKVSNGKCDVEANFLVRHDNMTALTNQYYNTNLHISNTDSVRWTFGDGTVSYDHNPIHRYSSAGIYKTCLRVKMQSNSATTSPCISEICKSDTAFSTGTQPCDIQAYFTIDSLAANKYRFNNTSAGYTSGDSIRWTFGDGTSSNSTNPIHTYTTAGTYNVCLRIVKKDSTNSTHCVSEYCREIMATVDCGLSANFTFYRDSSNTIANNAYHFTNTTTPLSSTDSIRWTFGDGTSSNQSNPVHIYSQGGNYNVCLRVIKRNPNGILSNCVSEICKQVVVITNNPCNVQVYFISSTDSAQYNFVHFANQSSGYASGDSITWTFGDGTTSHDVNPNHIYTTEGTYRVCLVIKKNYSGTGTAPCIKEYCKTINIVLPCKLQANFISYRDSLSLNAYTYHFNNTTTSLSSTDSIRWTFGDGSSSNQMNPVHGYAQPGTYNVCLRVIKRNPNGTVSNCVSEKCNAITVQQICNVKPGYTWVASTANYKTINFTNTTAAASPNPTVQWTFGDGTSATSWNAAHTYSAAGRYYVCLRIQYGNCVNHKCDSITVAEPTPACTQLSNYTFVKDAANNSIVSFTPDYINSNVQYTWTFGDGTGAQTANATHQFSAPGNYTVCLTAFKNSSCASTTCKTITIAAVSNCNNTSLMFYDVRDSMVPNRVTFKAASNGTITDQIWTITKQPATAGTGTTTIHGNNPTYVFLDSGVYKVCLRATFAGGCIKEYCRNIHIEQKMPTASNCSLQLYPNPATNVVNAVVTLAQPFVLYVSIYNSMNVQVAQKQQQGFVGNNTVSVNIEALPAGVYGYRIVYGNQLCSSKFLK